MCRRCFVFLLALSLALSFTPLRRSARAQAQSADKQVEKVRRTVRKIGVARRATIFLKDGDTLHGTLAQVGEDDFQITEVDRRQTFTVRYDEVKKVREGFGGINLFTGRRSSPRRGENIALFSALAFVLALPIIIVATAKN